MSGLERIFDSNFKTRQRRVTRQLPQIQPHKLVQRLLVSRFIMPRPTCCYQSILPQPSESLEGGAAPTWTWPSPSPSPFSWSPWRQACTLLHHHLPPPLPPPTSTASRPTSTTTTARW